MKYIDEFRDGGLAQGLAAAILVPRRHCPAGNTG